MDVKSLKFNCYIEGVRVPVFNIHFSFSRNTLSTCALSLPIGTKIRPLMWANALVQLTYIDNTFEKLLYEGLCIELNILEDASILQLSLVSKWDILNFNKTMDYRSPKKYGLSNLDEGLRIWVGNESVVSVSNADMGVGNTLSARYYYLQAEMDEISPNDSETHKIEYILNRTPSADRLGYVLFDDIVYQNFLLSRVYIERLNLLAKGSSRRETIANEIALENEYLTTGFIIEPDLTRAGKFWDRGGDIANFLEDPVKPKGQQTQATGSEAPLCRQALNDATRRWPTRSTSSDGIMGDAAHQARKSDHNDGNAVDITHDPTSGCSGDVIANYAVKDPRVKYIIFNRKIYQKSSGWEPYRGPNPHTTHCHISIYPDYRNDTKPWGWSNG